MATVLETLHELDLPALIELFIITSPDNVNYYITNTRRTTDIYWNGHKFLSFPVTITGIGFTTDNISEAPKLTLSTVGLSFSSLFPGITSLKGYSVTYLKTFETYIGTSAMTDTSIFIERKFYKFAKPLSIIPKTQVVYQLSTLTSWETKKLPARQMLREGPLNLRFEGLGVYKQF